MSEDEEAAPKTVASATDFGVFLPSERDTACLETSASTMADNRKPSASSPRTYQNMANDSRSAGPILSR